MAMLLRALRLIVTEVPNEEVASRTSESLSPSVPISKPSAEPLERLKTLDASVTVALLARLRVAALATLTVPTTSLEVKPFFRVPSETVMVPALPMLTVPEISRVPVPSFVTVVLVPVIPPVTVTLPEPAKVSARVPAATAVALLRVSVSESD